MKKQIGRGIIGRAVNVRVTKLALTKDQVDDFKLPPNPAKMSDSRAREFVNQHGDESFEVDALPPEVLQKMVRRAIQERMNMALYRGQIEEETRLKEKLLKVAAGVK